MTTLDASRTRIPPDTFNRVAYQQERVRIRRRGGVSVVLISEEDAALLEAIEDRLDIQAAEAVLADMKAKKRKPIPLAKVKARLGL